MARPREFDRVKVLAAAMELFWHQGYEGTSLSDLDQATGLNRGSLYNSFGSKRDLYLACLDLYGQSEIGAAVSYLEGSKGGDEAVAGLFKAAIGSIETGGDRRGCLLCNASIERAPFDPEVEARVREHLTALQQAIDRCLASGQGKKRPSAERRDLGRCLTMSYMGLMVIAKAGYATAHLRAAAKVALSVLEA